jgi:hypothetical protein
VLGDEKGRAGDGVLGECLDYLLPRNGSIEMLYEYEIFFGERCRFVSNGIFGYLRELNAKGMRAFMV